MTASTIADPRAVMTDRAARDADFAAYLQARQASVLRTAYLLSGDWHAAEDLTQETLLRMYDVWRRVSASGPPDAYAHKVLVNLHRQALRRPARREQPAESLPDRPARSTACRGSGTNNQSTAA